jgi:hypothetical protein
MVAYNPGSRPGVQSTYGGGLGSVFQYGHANPYGPTLGLNQRPGQRPAASSSQQSSTAPRPESAALSYLTGTVQGQNAPYNQQAIDSQYSQASGMNAAAETAQNTQAAEQAAAGGASPTDPSYQAAQRQPAGAAAGCHYPPRQRGPARCPPAGLRSASPAGGAELPVRWQWRQWQHPPQQLQLRPGPAPGSAVLHLRASYAYPRRRKKAGQDV